jgi:hypothetical protein
VACGPVPGSHTDTWTGYLIHEPGHLGPERRERIVCTGDQPLFLGIQQLADFEDGPGTRRRECLEVEAHPPIISPSFLTGAGSPSLEGCDYTGCDLHYPR